MSRWLLSKNGYLTIAHFRFIIGRYELNRQNVLKGKGEMEEKWEKDFRIKDLVSPFPKFPIFPYLHC